MSEWSPYSGPPVVCVLCGRVQDRETGEVFATEFECGTCRVKRQNINWISVNDRLPPDGVTVLVWGDGPSTAALEKGTWFCMFEGSVAWDGEYTIVPWGVTHWAEIEGPQI